MKEKIHKLWKSGGRRFVAMVVLLAMFCGILPDGRLLEHSVKAAEQKLYILYGSGERQEGSNGTYILRSQSGRLSLRGRDDIDKTKVSWHIGANPNIIQFDAASGSSITGQDSINFTPLNPGKVTIQVFVEGEQVDKADFTIDLVVGYYIARERPTTRAKAGIWMQDIMHDYEDTSAENKDKDVPLNYSIIMNEGRMWELGDGTSDSFKKEELNLVYGSAKRDVTWSAENENVVSIEGGYLVAKGTGHTVLYANPVASGSTDQKEADSIDVYVNPKVQIEDKYNEKQELVGPDASSGSTGNSAITVDTSAYIKLSDGNFDSAALNEQVYWVVERLEGAQDYVTVSEKGDVKSDIATLRPAGDGYTFVGKAGRYQLLFYPNGAYRDSKNKSKVAYTAVRVDVCSRFADNQAVRLNVGGKFDLSNFLNISEEILQKEYTCTPKVTTTSGGAILGDAYIPYIDINWSKSSLITAKKVGEVTLTITRRTEATTDILNEAGKSIASGDSITITLIIEESFALSSASLSIAVGQEADVYGMMGSEGFPADSVFEWKVLANDGKESQCVEIISGTDMSGVTIRGKKETLRDKPDRLILEWTDSMGITRVATCLVTVINSSTPVLLDHEELMMQSDDSAGEALTVTNYVEGTNLMWITSDSDIISVIPDSNYKNMARVVPSGKTGIAYVTVINKDNNQLAICRVVVDQYMTELKIDKGERFTAKLSDGTVLLKASYSPTNATSTDVTWTSTNPDVATVDYNGLDCIVHLNKVGTAIIRVASNNQPAAYSVYAECILTVETVPLSNISVKESNLTMTVGSTYTVVPTLSPANATNSTLTWQTGNAGIAKVDNNGVITAVKPGQTTITVSGGEAKPVSIIVTVMNKLKTIKFEETEVTLEEGEKHELKVIYSPEADVNTKITFTSTNTSVVTVDAKGVITGVSEGLAMIIATAEELGTTGAITCMVHVTAETIETEEFEIDPEEMTLIVGEEQEITPIYTPDDATHQEVTYTAGNEAVATVSEEGLVTAVSPGFTIITCQDVATGKTAICQVTVEPGVQFSLSPATREIALGKSFKLKKVTVPSNAKKTATWKSSNKSIATVNSSGKVTGKKIGSCTITCTLTYYGASATCRVKVAKLKSTVKLDKTSIRMNLGSTYKLKKTVKSNDSKLPSVKFTSKNSKIASVGTNSGKIKAKKVGSTYITAKTTDASHGTARCRVTVIRRATSVSLNKTYAVCYIGSTLMLKATVKPSNATIKKVSWSSSDKNIAAVTGSGKITGYAEGETYITATTTDGSNKKARCLVKVMEPIAASSILVAQRDLTMRVGDTTTLSYTVLPNDTTDTIKMASDNKRVATVTNSGKVRAVGPGNATITITSSSGVTATVNINVVALNKTSIRLRQYDTETLVVHGAVDPITWYSGNNSIATVTNGRIVGRGIGTTYVYAYVNGCRLSCRVEVIRIS